MTEESTLVERIRNGDMNSFREVVDKYKGVILAVVYDMTNDRHDAEDLLQDVFIKVFRSMPSFRGDSKFSTWIYRIAMNTCYDHVTKRSYRSTRPSEMHGVPPHSVPMFHAGGADPERLAVSGMMQEHIDRAIRSLSPRERSVFVLRHYHDLPLKEIASALRISEGTVKSMLSRALERLKKELSFYRKELGMEDAQ